MRNGEFSEAFRGQNDVVTLLCVREAYCGVVNEWDLHSDTRQGERRLGRAERAGPAAAAGSASGWLLASQQTNGLTLRASLDGSVQLPVGTSAPARPLVATCWQTFPFCFLDDFCALLREKQERCFEGRTEMLVGCSLHFLQAGLECGVGKSLTSTSVSPAANEVGFLQICVSCLTDLGVAEGVSSDLGFFLWLEHF